VRGAGSNPQGTEHLLKKLISQLNQLYFNLAPSSFKNTNFAVIKNYTKERLMNGKTTKVKDYPYPDQKLT
jgi:hypothetical protein